MTTTECPLIEIDMHPIIFKMQCEGEMLNGKEIDFEAAVRTYRQFLNSARSIPRAHARAE
jgi:hypothetical protein